MSLIGTFRTQLPRWQMSAVERDVRIASPDFRFPKRTSADLLATSDQAIFFVRGTMLVSTVSEAGSGPAWTLRRLLRKVRIAGRWQGGRKALATRAEVRRRKAR